MRTRVALLGVALVLGCNDATRAAEDATANADGGPCVDCDDGIFCNGVEHCVGSLCVRGTPPCSAGQICDEAMLRCFAHCANADADHDGHVSLACGGDDCDDTRADVHPGALEICDSAGVDEDCNPMTHGGRDVDHDGFEDATCCNARDCGTDCDDMHADVHPGASETCNQRDDDCDAAIDESLTPTIYFPDCDHDAFGDAMATPLASCAPPAMPPTCTGGVWSTIAGDCDDMHAQIHPGALEVCDGLDDDCTSGGGPVPAEDVDGDGHTSTTYTSCTATGGSMQRDDCDDTDPNVHPGAPVSHFPRCGTGPACLGSSGFWFCGPANPTTYACLTADGASPASWDWDCSGVEERDTLPANPTCGFYCSVGGGCDACRDFRGAMVGCPVPTMPGELFLAASPPAGTRCGTVVNYASCSGACPSACSTMTQRLPLACR